MLEVRNLLVFFVLVVLGYRTLCIINCIAIEVHVASNSKTTKILVAINDKFQLFYGPCLDIGNPGLA